MKSFLTLIADKHFSSTVLRVVHLHVTTTFEAQDLCALYLHIPQLYPVDVTPVYQVSNKISKSFVIFIFFI